MAEIEHENTEQIVCPWCGYQYEDSFEFPDEDKADCAECENPFKHYRIIDITYDTEKDDE